jgi:hypothetical protein
VVLVVVQSLLEQQVLEIHRQQHHLKETIAELLVHLRQIMVAGAVVALALLVATDQELLVVQVGPEQRHHFQVLQ